MAVDFCSSKSAQNGLKAINPAKYNQLMAQCKSASETRGMISDRNEINEQLEEREFNEKLQESSKTPFENPKYQFAAIGLIILIIGLIVWKRS